VEHDLKLLQRLLDCSCDENKMVNEDTYTGIMRQWVDSIRDHDQQYVVTSDSPSVLEPEVFFPSVMFSMLDYSL